MPHPIVPEASAAAATATDPVESLRAAAHDAPRGDVALAPKDEDTVDDSPSDDEVTAEAAEAAAETVAAAVAASVAEMETASEPASDVIA